jgi:hypothetical protein
MRGTLFGRLSRPAVAVVGVWDPLMDAHEEMLVELRREASLSGRSSLVIAIDPDPAQHLYGAAACPVYNDLPTRVERLLGLGVDGVLVVDFGPADLEAGARELLDVIQPWTSIAELWLGARQSLGRMERGNALTIEALAAERGFRVRRLPTRQLGTAEVRELLRAGRIRDAMALGLLPPMRKRPASNRLSMSWREGSYDAVPLAEARPIAGKASLQVELTSKASELAELYWPSDEIEYLAFVAGPGDVRAPIGEVEGSAAASSLTMPKNNVRRSHRGSSVKS